ncbi:hypothetical protein [Modestobacter sp. NPDC049651]|uniref:hypothetical protein n=1 Tax=unclassified Modestobacter TaxID=2643866 RepID=UPI0034035BE2
MIEDWEPPLPEGWVLDDVFAGEPVDDRDTRLLLSGPDAPPDPLAERRGPGQS